MNSMILRLPAVVLLGVLAGCVSVSRREGAVQVGQLVAERSQLTLAWPTGSDTAEAGQRITELLHQPLDADAAIVIASLRNPRLASAYAELGIAQAEVVAASRIGNPGLSASVLDGDGAPSKMLGLSLPLADLLLLPARRKQAEAGYAIEQQEIAAELVAFDAEVRAAWTTAAAANQIAAMRTAVADAASASAELAQRFHDAGNLSQLDLDLEQAAASQARIARARAEAEAMRARLALNTVMGLSGSEADAWQFDLPLALPVSQEDSLEVLRELASRGRLDLAAAQDRVALREQTLATTRRWRLLAPLDIGVEREREDGERRSGPTLSLGLPLFDQGQAAVARADAELEKAQAELAQLTTRIDNEIRLGQQHVAAMRRIVETYRDALVPQREAIVQGKVKQHNYMLIGPFELLLARQQEFDAYQEYIEAVRDYWLARVELAQAIGQRLPSDADISARTPTLDLPTPAAPAPRDHSHHSQPAAGHDHSQHQSKPAEPAPATPEPHHHHHGATP